MNAISILAEPAKSHTKEPVTRVRLIALLLALITLAVYSPVTRYDFIDFDDGGYVYQNRVVQNGLTWSGVKWAFTHQLVGNWHPLTVLSHMLDCELFGLNAGRPHLVNLLFHTANAVLLLLLLLRLTGALWPSAIVAALFAWHPLHVESVAWISERKDVLSTFFELLALSAYVRHVQEKRRGLFWCAWLFFALGLMAKPMLVTLPFVLLLLDYWPLQRVSTANFEFSTLQRLTLEKWPFFLLTILCCGATFLAQRAGKAVVTLAAYPLPLRLANTLVSYGRYLLKTVWPVDLAIVYPLQTHPARLGTMTAIALVVLSAITWLAWRTRRSYPYFLVGWFWFLGTLVPVIGLVQVGRQGLADRYTYVPLIGVFIAVVFGIKDLLARLRPGFIAATVAASLTLASCLVLTESQLHYWRNSEALFSHALMVTKDNATAHSDLGQAFAREGRQNEALAEYREALRIEPNSADTRNNLATLLDEMGKPDEALAEYRRSLRLDPFDVPANINLGMVLVQLGRLDEAIQQYTQTARLDPENPDLQFQMGRALLLQGHDAAAISCFRRALRLSSNDFEILIYVARVLASDENETIRQGTIALALAAKANHLTQETQPLAFDTIAMAYAEIGRFPEAGQAEETAIKFATAYGQNGDVPAMKQRLELYKNGRPCRQTFTQTRTTVPPDKPPKN